MSTESITFVFVALVLASQSARLSAANPTTRPTQTLLPHPWNEQPVLFDDDDDDDDDKPKIKTPATTQSIGAPSSSRYFFGLLDSRSSYGRDFFPDLFLGPEFDRETQIEVDYAHGERRNLQENEVDTEVEWNPIGQLTFAGEFGWDSEHQINLHGGGDGDDIEQENARGFESVDLAAFHPIFQCVSNDRVFDYTAVARVDLSIPTRTEISGKDLQLTPYLGQLLRIGDHVSIEGWTGSQFTIAPDQTSQFIYGASFGYQIFHDQLPLPLTHSVTPLFELDGQRPFSNHGQDALFGVAGFDWQFPDIGKATPKLGIGYEFPIDEGASNQLRWGIIAQVFIEF